MQSTWEAEHSQALREYLAKGMSYSEIADALNARIGTDYSRSGAIGRAKRPGYDRPPALPEAAAESQGGAAAPAARAPCSRIHAADAGFRTHGGAKTALRRGRAAAPPFAGRSGTRRLPLPLWRRRGGRSHHLLRASAA